MGQVIPLPPTDSREPLLKLRDLMGLYGFSERWFRYRIAEGMPRHRWGGQWRFRASEVEEWMQRRSRSGGTRRPGAEK